jgi:hypothetical protein
VYLLAHVAARIRNVHTVNWYRLGGAIAMAAFLPVAVAVPALVTVAFIAGALALLIGLESIRYAGVRARLSQQLAEEAATN